MITKSNVKIIYPFFLIIFLSFQSSRINAQQFQNAQETFGKYVTWGTVWGDYNNDGYVDLYLSNGQQDYEWEGLLYKNNGDGTFTSITTAGDIVTEKFTSGGSSWGDYNNDGYLDMYVANVVKKSGFSYNYLPNSLHTNNGDGTFTKESTASVGDIVKTQSSSSGAVEWLDYNNDGYLDAVTSNATLFGAANNLLYENSGSPSYTFTEVSNTFSSSGTSMRAGISGVDFDEDGDIDIVVVSGNEYNNTRLYVNTGTPSYDFSITTLLGSSKPTQGASWGDIDNDGDLDLYLANGGTDGTPSSPTTNNLFRNDGGTLTEITSGVGPLITDSDFSYAPAFGDFDNDGDLDLFVGNDGKYDDGYRCRLYENDGTGVFTSNTSTTLTIDNDFVRSAAWADLDNDGDLDLMVGREGPNRLYINNGNSNHWVEVKTVGDGTSSNKLAIGALVKLNATINTNTYTQIRDVSSQSSRGSHNDLTTHFGLGNATKINTVSVNWPGAGTTTSMTDIPTNKLLVYTQGNLSASASVTKEQNFMYLFGNSKAAVEFTSNTDTDGGTLTMTKTESNPAGTFNGSSATSAAGTTITANAVVNDRYWTITQSGLTGFTTTVYLDAGNLPSGITVDDLVILKRSNSSSDWTPLNTSKIGNTVYATGITSFSEFALGYESVILEVKIFLEGPYNGTDMNVLLNSEIPTTSPYTEDPRTVSSVPADVVDWVLVELRKDANGTAVKSKSVFLFKNGKLVNDDASAEEVKMDIPKGDYFIVIKHRNHLSVMSANAVALSGTANLYDFTTGSEQFYGTNGAKQLGN
jgi:hypothetical protein